MTDQFLPSYPDWNIYPSQVPGTDTDLTETAARLGALSTYRRTGRLIWQADFMSLSGWEIGGGAIVTPSYSQSYNGSCALKLTSGDIYFTHPRVLQTTGIELVLHPTIGVGGFPDSTFVYYYADPRMFAFIIYWNTAELWRSDFTLGWVKVCDIPPVALAHFPWHNLKFTIDVTNEKYGWVYYDDIQINLSASIPDVSAIALNGDIVQLNNTRLANQGVVYIGNLIITTNEAVT